MSFETNPQVFRVGIRSRGGELLTPSALDFRKMAGSGGGFQGDLPGLAFIYRMRNEEGVRRLLGQLVGDLANRTQGYWRQLIYQRSPSGITRSGYSARSSRLPVNWRGDYARAVRVRRNQYSANVIVDSTVARYLHALETGSKALGQRYFAFISQSGQHSFINRVRRTSTANYHRVSLGTGLDERKRSLEGRDLRPEEASLQSNLQRRYAGEQGEGTERILEWARNRFGAGSIVAERRSTNRKGYSRRGVRTVTDRQKRETPSAVEKNAFRLLLHIRTRGTKPAHIFTRLRESMAAGGPLRSELNEVTNRWYKAVREGSGYRS